MTNKRMILLLILIAIVFGTLMAFRGGMQADWQRILLAAGAFGMLGLLLGYFRQRRK